MAIAGRFAPPGIRIADFIVARTNSGPLATRLWHIRYEEHADATDSPPAKKHVEAKGASAAHRLLAPRKCIYFHSLTGF
jgi:hypothetical protein